MPMMDLPEEEFIRHGRTARPINNDRWSVRRTKKTPSGYRAYQPTPDG